MPKRVLIKRLLMYSGYVVYLLLCLELLSRAFLAIPVVFDRVIPLRIECDSARRLRWIQQYRTALEKMRSSMGRYDPETGWRLKPNIRHMPVYDNKFLSSNSRGVRGSVEYGEKKPGCSRVLVMGDSFTFEEDVSDNETYPFYLQQLLPGTEVINLGISGFGHDQMLIYFQQEGIRYKPDIVILGFLSIDMARNLLTFRDYAKPRFTASGGRLVLAGSPVPSPEQLVEAEPFRSKFLDLLCIAYCKSFKRTGLYKRMRYELAGSILAELNRTIESSGAIPVFVLIDPERGLEEDREIAQQEETFEQLCRQCAVEHRILLRAYFKEAAQRNVAMKTTRHFNPEENLVVARGIADYLQANGLLQTTQAAGGH